MSETEEINMTKKEEVVMEEEEEEKKDDSEQEIEKKLKDMSYEERIQAALELKLMGNDEYKKKNFEVAIKKYNRGVQYVKNIKNDNKQMEELIIALYLNLSLCYSNLEQYNDAHTFIEKVLQIDKTNEKGMFRLCQIEYNRCNLEIAKEKIQEFMKVYPEKIEAKKLLKSILVKEAEDNKKQKEAFSKIFEKASGLYEDREREIMKKKKEKYEKDMKARREKNEEIIEFEKWEEEEKERMKEESENRRKEEEKKRKKKESEKKNEVKSYTSKNNGPTQLEMDEEDQKIIDETRKMGYCYFKKDIKEDDKKLFEKNIPKKIESPDIDGTLNSNNSTNDNKAISTWNSAGTTYEEKEMSAWAKKRIEEGLQKIDFKSNDCNNIENSNEVDSYFENYSKDRYPDILPLHYIERIELTELKDVSVDAQIVVIRGTKRHIFELSCKLYITIYLKITELHIHKVILEIKELSSEIESGKTWRNFINLRKNDKLKTSDNLFSKVYEYLLDQVENQIRAFIEDYNTM